MRAFDDAQLIFLISQPRAGSTLLQRMLGMHPAIHTTAEPWLMLHPLYARRPTGHTAEYDATLAATALDEFLRTMQAGDAVYQEALRRMAFHLYGTAVAEAGKSRFLDKTPRYYLIVPELAALFPRARFLILLRNPLAVLNSILTTRVKGHWELLGRYRNDLLAAPGRLVAAPPLLAERAHVVRYEMLVTRPSDVVETICDWLGLAYDEGLLAYGRGPEPAGSMGDQTGIARHTQPSTASLERWHALGRQPQTRHLAEQYVAALGPELLGQMGYSASDLLAALCAQPCSEGRVDVSWDSLFAPGAPFTRRQQLAELALLEHRRLVFWLRNLRTRLVGK